MEVASKDNNKYILRLEPGEEVINAVESFSKEAGIKSAWFQVIGGAKDIELAFYNTKTKEYETKTYEDFFEIISISGNISIKEGEPFCHAHGVFGKTDMSTLGGHVMKCPIPTTAEISLIAFAGSMHRRFDEETGLHFLREN